MMKHDQNPSAPASSTYKQVQAPDVLGSDLSDMLPPKWTENTSKCSLVYWSPSLEYYLFVKIFHMKDFALIHLLKDEGVSINDMDVHYKTYFGDDFTTYKGLFIRPEALINAIDTLLIKPSFSEMKKNVSQAPHIRTTQEKEVIRTESQTIFPPPSSIQAYLPCGRCDLDPLCACRRGGMIFDPLRDLTHPPPPPFIYPHPYHPPDNPYRIPSGSVPPGARFDPIGPNDPDFVRSLDPDPDEMKKPTFNDRFNL